MICPQCQSENIEGSAFCDNCGASLANVSSSPAPAVAPPVAPLAEPPAQDANAAPPPTPPVPPAPFAPPPAPPLAAPSLGASDKIKCSFCGAENEAANAFCENCGTPLSAAASAPPTPPAPPTSLPQTPEPTMPVAPPQPSAPTMPVAPPVSTTAPSAMIVPAPASKPAPAGHPRLVVVSSGMYFDLSGYQDILIGRVDPTANHFPQVDLTAHGGDEGGVSRKHLRITLAGNQYFAEDLGSSNGSWLGTQRLMPNQRAELNSGDQLRLGKLVLNFYAQ